MSFKSCNVPLFFDALPTPAQTESLRDFLISTEVPLDPSYYHSQIAASTPILARYDTEIERLKKTLQDRSMLKDHVYGCQAALPIRRLPPEILVEIFAPSSFSSSSPPKTKALDDLAKFDLLQLSQVWSYWHTLVMDTPSLWSHIAVNASWAGKCGFIRPPRSFEYIP
ncbi:hypothetical protein C8R43DRAFT_184470 [Mycena crocata]|nr:hypothetical protein C8R43DRAFT_184470 [Mycena crocata]